MNGIIKIWNEIKTGKGCWKIISGLVLNFLNSMFFLFMAVLILYFFGDGAVSFYCLILLAGIFTLTIIYLAKLIDSFADEFFDNIFLFGMQIVNKISDFIDSFFSYFSSPPLPPPLFSLSE